MGISVFDASDFSTTAPLYAQIVHRIRQAILQGMLKPNDVLPSERELAQRFGVSRVPVREALKILEFLGVVEPTRGKGLFVRQFDMSTMLDVIDLALTDPERTLSDLFETREAIETQAAKLAALRRTDTDLVALESAIIQMEVEIRMHHPVEDTSKKFHSAVVDASHNELLIRILQYLHNLLDYSRHQTLRSPERHTNVLEYHKIIFTHIKNRDGDSASEVMRSHLKEARLAVEKTEPQ